jgi:hypothetical protein
MAQSHDNGQPAHEAYAAPQKTPPWFVRTWPYTRAALLVVLLVPEKPQGLHLTVQALVVAGDLVVNAVATVRR